MSKLIQSDSYTCAFRNKTCVISNLLNVGEEKAGYTQSFYFQPVVTNCIIFLLEGEVYLKSSLNSSTTLKAGSLLFIPISATFEYEVIKDTKFLFFGFNRNTLTMCEKNMFDGFQLEEGEQATDNVFGMLPIKDQMMSFVNFLIECIAGEMKCINFYQTQFNGLMILLRYVYTKNELESFFAPLIGAELNFRLKVLENMHCAKNRKEYAKITGHSITSFARKFKEEFGMSPYAWIQKKRDRKIIQLLSNESISFIEICDALSFSSQSHFTKHCKERFGFTPTELRYKLRNNEWNE